MLIIFASSVRVRTIILNRVSRSLLVTGPSILETLRSLVSLASLLKPNGFLSYSHLDKKCGSLSFPKGDLVVSDSEQFEYRY